MFTSLGTEPEQTQIFLYPYVSPSESLIVCLEEKVFYLL